ncbi:MAG: septum formation protein Maf [candidate division Zixibacteria bacterium]|nr:septum formation protein Maf [candidate division Zixibacteria bacterium]
MEPVVLASGSPRRASLLTQIGLAFEVIVSHAPETDVSFDDPAAGAITLALRKASKVAVTIPLTGRTVIGADTIVVFESHILGKPKSPAEAADMLGRLAGHAHRVITGVALVETGTQRAVTFYETTTVFIRGCSEAEIAAYVATGEPLDKAGAYGAQGYGAALIERVEGCFYNVVGMPLARLTTAMRQFREG